MVHFSIRSGPEDDEVDALLTPEVARYLCQTSVERAACFFIFRNFAVLTVMWSLSPRTSARKEYRLDEDSSRLPSRLHVDVKVSLKSGPHDALQSPFTDYQGISERLLLKTLRTSSASKMTR